MVAPSPPNAPSRIERLFARAFLGMVSVGLGLLLLEVGASAWLQLRADEEEFVRYASLRQLQDRAGHRARYSPHRYLGYYPTPGYVDGDNRHNALGYRGEEVEIPKPAGRFRIVCLGGSTTYTTHVGDFRKSYPDQLGAVLRERGVRDAEVINAGAGSWSSFESLINLELRVLDLEPDLLIVYHGINDIHPRLVWPPEAYRGDNSGHRAPNLTALFMPRLHEHSTLLRILSIRAGRAQPHAAFERTIDRSAETSHSRRYLEQELAGEYPRGVFRETPVLRMLRENPPVYFERNVRNMVAIARDRGIDIVLSSFAYSPLFRDEPRVASGPYVRAHEENNAMLRRVASETDVPFFDFAGAFPATRAYFSDGRHVNEAGARRKAELFGGFLIDRELLSAPGQPAARGDRGEAKRLAATSG